MPARDRWDPLLPPAALPGWLPRATRAVVVSIVVVAAALFAWGLADLRLSAIACRDVTPDEARRAGEVACLGPVDQPAAATSAS